MTIPVSLPTALQVRPDWLADAPPAAQGRLVRGGADVSVRSMELPHAHELTVTDEATHEGADGHTDLGADGADDVGAATLAWAMAYRAGFEAGRADGHQVGVEIGSRDGRATAVADGLARTEAGLHELRAGADRHVAALESVTRNVAEQATELAFEIARAVLDRELVVAEDPGADAIRRALASLSGNAAAFARLHPDDIAGLREDPASIGAGRALEVVADPSIAPGDCRIESGATSIDASVSAAMTRVRGVLGLTDGGTTR